MDIQDLFMSCRKGDLERIKYLVEEREVELNVRDRWDSTPLYYACLCGHKDVVQYLLESGARCKANTFDGERCLYGALTSDIRDLLRSYKVVTSSTLRRDGYDQFLRRCYEDGEYCDVLFCVRGREFPAHRCILAARSEFFHDAFLNKWKDRKVINVNNRLVEPTAFEAVLRFLYTGTGPFLASGLRGSPPGRRTSGRGPLFPVGRLEAHGDRFDDLVCLARHCRLASLAKRLEEAHESIASFERSKPGTKVTTILLEPDYGELQRDFGLLAGQAVPQELGSWAVGNEHPFLPRAKRTTYADLCLSVEGKHFLCHKAFFCGRSDYFRALLRDHFAEARCSRDFQLPVITLRDVSSEVFERVLSYVYENAAPELSVGNVLDVMCTADLYLLPGLKRLCGTFLAQRLRVSTVCHALRTARMFRLPRLEERCTEFMAEHIEQMVRLPEFQEVVKEDAMLVKSRQETDSIAVVDDIRYHIAGNVQTFSAVAEADEKLAAVDDLLDSLGLDA